MAVSDFLQPGLTSKQRVKIMTVDPDTRRVEAVLKDGSMIQIAIWETPTVFRWPKQEEIWTVRRDNGYWMLDSPMDEGQAAINMGDMEPGDVQIKSPGIIYGNQVHIANLTAGDSLTETLDVGTLTGDSITGDVVNADVANIDSAAVNALNVNITSSPFVTSLPNDPAHGQDAYYKAATGVVWHFKYDSTLDTYPWLYMGGPPLRVVTETAFDEIVPNNSGYLALGAAGPALAIPFAGEYTLEQYAYVDISTASAAGSWGFVMFSYDRGGVAAVDADAMYEYIYGPGIQVQGDRHNRVQTTISTPQTLTAKYRALLGANGFTGKLNSRELAATPVRVGNN